MCNAVVIYNSQTGFTKKYAGWISEALGCDCLEFSAAKKCNLNKYDMIIYGGWACAGSISKIKWFKENITKWNGKKLAVFCVGGSPNENPEIEIAMKSWFSKEGYKTVKAFYCQGGFNYDKMSVPSKMMMKMFISALKAKKNKSEDDEKVIKLISSSYDISDIKYIEPIIEWAKNATE